MKETFKAQTNFDAARAEEERLRAGIARRLERMLADQKRCWRDCPAACCRRARHCEAPRGICINLPPSPPSTPEETARAMADLKRRLRERLGQLGAAKR